MSQGPRTFRDPFLSLYQSMMSDIAKANSPGASLEAVNDEDAPKPDEVAAAELVAARSAVAEMRAAGVEPKLDQTALEDMSVPENIQVCAALAKDLLVAKIFGNQARAKEIEQEFLPGSKCDPKWITTINEYVKYFGPTGNLREIPYIKPSTVGPKVIKIKASARIGLVGDWGTGAAPAKRVLAQLGAQNPDVVIHLGDIYYSGTEEECRTNFVDVVDNVLERATKDIAVYTLAGNHDMYCGGIGFYAMLKGLNKPAMAQPASFFCLRAQDNSWQLLAMDTGKHDFSPVAVTHAETLHRRRRARLARGARSRIPRQDNLAIASPAVFRIFANRKGAAERSLPLLQSALEGGLRTAASDGQKDPCVVLGSRAQPMHLQAVSRPRVRPLPRP